MLVDLHANGRWQKRGKGAEQGANVSGRDPRGKTRGLTEQALPCHCTLLITIHALKTGNIEQQSELERLRVPAVARANGAAPARPHRLVPCPHTPSSGPRRQ